MRTIFSRGAGAFLLHFFLVATAGLTQEKVLSVGYFPNLTHAPALIAQNMAIEGKGWFEQRLGGVQIKWQAFNAGPSAMEALFAKAIDITYVGPSPVLNAFIRSRGGVFVVSGAVRGGAGLVVPAGSGLTELADFRDKRIATPQLGNTQDVACRYWFSRAGLAVNLTGGDVTIIPTPNATMQLLFTTGQIDAAWTVEPWVSRLELEGGGKLVYAEPVDSSITTVLAVSSAYVDAEPEMAQKFAAAHAELTAWIRQNPDEAKKRVADELSRQTRRPFPLELVERAWPRLVFDNAISEAEFEFSLNAAREAGFIRGEFDLKGLVQKQ